MYPQLLRKAINQSSPNSKLPANLAVDNEQDTNEQQMSTESQNISNHFSVEEKSPKGRNSQSSSRQHSYQLRQPCWDLYPFMQRSVENRGTGEQRHILHEQEHSLPLDD
jgi:hypothetical protein